MSLPAANICCDRRPADHPLPDQAPSVPASVSAQARVRILFVDDEPAMLRVLKMGMRSMAAAWVVDFAASGEEAIAILKQKRFDVVVTDMRMPGINGAQLLNHVLRHQPQCIRIVLSGYSDLSQVVNCVGLTHQFMEKPCSLEELKDCLKRLTQAKNRLANEQLCLLAGSLKNLPSLPELYLEIAEVLQSASASTERIAEIASRDPALTAKLLQLSNSAFFGFSRKVYSVAEAVQLLGVSVIQSLAIAVPIFASFDRSKCPGFPIEQIWEHSVQTGAMGRRISNQRLDDAYLSEQVFCAGILHDIGKIMLANGMPGEYATVLKEAGATQTPLWEVEQRHFQATHAEVGAYLLALWGLPIPLVEAVANHHHPRRCGTHEFCLAGVVHIANALQHAQTPQAEVVSPIDDAYLKYVGLEEQFELWRTEFAGEKS
jgi:HD-like signal output (HDOD) protein